MNVPIHPLFASAPASPLRLSHTTRLTSTRELTLGGVAGWSWITIDNDPRDIVLGSGQRHTVPAHRRVTVTALHPGSRFELTVTPVTPPPRPLAALAAAARRAWRGMVAAHTARSGPGWSA